MHVPLMKLGSVILELSLAQSVSGYFISAHRDLHETFVKVAMCLAELWRFTARKITLRKRTVLSSQPSLKFISI